MARFSPSTAINLAAILSLVAVVASLLVHGWDYYLTRLPDRPFHPMHAELRPSGSTGHLLGITGGFIMLLTFLYPLRKRMALLQRFGTQSQWLQVHILFGLGGPALVVFHTAGKLGGLASIGFYATMAMVLSGIFGRYLYAKVPRTRRGNAMTLAQIEAELANWVAELAQDGGGDQLLAAVEDYLAQIRRQPVGLIRTLFISLADDLRSPLRIRQAWHIAGLHPATFRQRWHLTRLILSQRKLLKKLAILDASQRLLAYWHVFHRPFTILAFVVIAVHVAVALYMGYGAGWSW